MKSFFVFDVESIGLHGEAFAVGGGVYLENGSAQWEFRIACNPSLAAGVQEDRQWVSENIHPIQATASSPKAVRDEFWKLWVRAYREKASMAVECGWPVEARFLCACIDDDEKDVRRLESPYPVIEIASVMMAAGMDPMTLCDRLPSELPRHDPLADARQSARLLSEALAKLNLAS